MPHPPVALFCLPCLGVISPFVLCDQARNNSKKRQLFDEYARRGEIAPGVVLQAKTTVYRGSITRREHFISYAYRIPGTDDLCVKPTVKVPFVPISRRISVLVLPEYPNSGYLSFLLDHDRDYTFSSVNTVGMCLFLLAVHLVGTAIGVFFLLSLISCSGDLNDSEYDKCLDETPILPAFLVTCGFLLLLSYFLAELSWNGWKQGVLHKSCQTVHPQRTGGYSRVADSDIPMADVLSVIAEEEEEGQTLENNINHHGDIETAAVEEGRGSPPVAVAQATAVPVAKSMPSRTSVTPTVVAEASIVAQDTISFYEPAAADEKAEVVRAAVQNNSWTVLRDVFAEIRGCHIERAFYVDVIQSSWDKIRKEDVFCPVLDAWAQFEPGNPDCCLVRGGCYLRWAWVARGSGLARTVDKDAWPKFFARLDQAKAELEHASELDPSDAQACAYLVTVLRAQQGRNEEGVRALMAKLSHSDDPSNLYAHWGLLQFYCRKWGGSDEEMFGFARNTTKNLPEGHPLWMLIVQAHYEAGMMLCLAARESGLRAAIVAAASYWKRPSVKQEILQSYHQYVGSSRRKPAETAAEESVLMTARNWYAYSLARIGHMEMARRELLLIGNHPTERPWGSIDRYQRACNEAGVSL